MINSYKLYNIFKMKKYIKKIGSTYLKQNTKKVLDSVVKDSTIDHIIYGYNEPRAVVISYEKWQQSSGFKNSGLEKLSKPKLIHEKMKKYMFNGPRVNSSKIIRNIRDEE